MSRDLNKRGLVVDIREICSTYRRFEPDGFLLVELPAFPCLDRIVDLLSVAGSAGISVDEVFKGKSVCWDTMF